MIEQTFNFIGGYGTLILFFISIKLLWTKSNFLAYYSYGFFLEIILNLILKGIFKQPRPLEDPELFKLAIKSENKFMFPNGIPYNIFGMPSGHTSSAFYSGIFIYLSLKNLKIFIGYVLFSLLIVSHRLYFSYHTFIQTIVGAFVGLLFGSFMYYMATQKIMGKISDKLDDFAHHF